MSTLERLKTWIFLHVFPEKVEFIGRLAIEKDQVLFLLNQAPLMDVPQDLFLSRYRNLGVAFAYMHPETFSKLGGGREPDKNLRVGGSPTRWVLTEFMPRNQVIFSKNEMPGVANGNQE